MHHKMAQEDLTKIIRREFLSTASKIGGITILGGLPGCVYTNLGNIATEELKRAHPPREFRGYRRHLASPPPGIDLQAGYGHPLVAPVNASVWVTEELERQGYISCYLETDLGHIIHLSGQSAQYVTPNDVVNPLTPIGREGLNTPHATESHAHLGDILPAFAKMFNKGVYLHRDSFNGVEYVLDNPDLNSANDTLINSPFKGDNSLINTITKQAQGMFYNIADKHPKSHLAWFMRESNKDPSIRFFPKVMVAYIMLENGILETEELKKDVLDYLKWHSSVKIGIFLPYPNPELSYENTKLHRPDYKKNIISAWQDVVKTNEQKKWHEMKIAVDRYRQLSPFWGELSTEWSSGTAALNSRNPEKALVHYLLALGLLQYKNEHNTEELKNSYLKLNRNVALAYARLGMTRESQIFQRKIPRTSREIDGFGLTKAAFVYDRTIDEKIAGIGPGPGPDTKVQLLA